MADVNTKTFPQLLQGIAATMQSSASGLVDFSVGSIPRAFAESFAGVVLWLEGLILALLKTTRASTSSGADLDSFINDIAGAPTPADQTLISRLTASVSNGSLVFSRLTSTGTALIPVGAKVSTQDGSQQFVVILDTGNAAYNATLGGYLMATGISTLTVKAQSVTMGAAANAVAGAINTITSPIPGVDGVTNPAAMTGGFDAESDSAYLSRFRAMIQSLREATPKALASYITNLQQGVQCACYEFIQYDGTAKRAYFYFIVDDGSGSPPASLINAAASTVDTHRAAGVEFNIYAPAVVSVAVSMTVVNTATSAHATVVAIVQAAVTAYLNSIPLGQNVYYSRLWQIAQDASVDVVEITGLTLAGATVDYAITRNQVAKAGAVTVV